MRIIAINTIQNYWKEYPECEHGLKAWIQEVENAKWSTPQDLKSHFKSASILTGKRIIFNIKGNQYRLVVDIEFRLQIIF